MSNFFKKNPPHSFLQETGEMNLKKNSALSAVKDALGFAFAALDQLRRDQFDFDAQADQGLNGVGDFFLERFKSADLVGENLFVDFNIHFNIIHTIFGIENDIVMRAGSLDRQQSRFDLGREDVDAADNHHVV